VFAKGLRKQISAGGVRGWQNSVCGCFSGVVVVAGAGGQRQRKSQRQRSLYFCDQFHR